MARRRGSGEALNAWPGYVDALSTLLMVIIFVLLVFVLAQAFLSVTLSGRDEALARLNHQMTELSDLLQIERGHTQDLRGAVSQANRDLQAAAAERDSLSQQLAGLRAETAQISAERDTLRGERDRLQAGLADATVRTRAAEGRGTTLAGEVAAATQRAEVSDQQAAMTAAQLADAQARLAEARRQIDDMRQQASVMDQTVQADRSTIAAKLSEIARLAEQTRALTALRDQFERQAQDAAVRATTEAERRAATEAKLAEQTKFSDSAKAQIALMSQDLETLRGQIATVKQALDAADAEGQNKDTKIADLSTRLNAALAQKVEELQRYRSDFFGKLREVLANRPGVQVVGDRFVFQSEVLFPAGSADLSGPGREQIAQLAATLKDIARDIPPDVNWILRVDGHADRQPVDPNGVFLDNWDLSAKRSIKVVQLLIDDGIPANRLAATAFGDKQPLDESNTPDAFRRNRRIEIRLTDR